MRPGSALRCALTHSLARAPCPAPLTSHWLHGQTCALLELSVDSNAIGEAGRRALVHASQLAKSMERLVLPGLTVASHALAVASLLNGALACTCLLRLLTSSSSLKWQRVQPFSVLLVPSCVEYDCEHLPARSWTFLAEL